MEQELEEALVSIFYQIHGIPTIDLRLMYIHPSKILSCDPLIHKDTWKRYGGRDYIINQLIIEGHEYLADIIMNHNLTQYVEIYLMYLFFDGMIGTHGLFNEDNYQKYKKLYNMWYLIGDHYWKDNMDTLNMTHNISQLLISMTNARMWNTSSDAMFFINKFNNLMKPIIDDAFNIIFEYNDDGLLYPSIDIPDDLMIHLYDICTWITNQKKWTYDNAIIHDNLMNLIGIVASIKEHHENHQEHHGMEDHHGMKDHHETKEHHGNHHDQSDAMERYKERYKERTWISVEYNDKGNEFIITHSNLYDAYFKYPEFNQSLRSKINGMKR